VANLPEVVVQFGAAPTTRAAQRLVSRADRLIVVSPAPADPGRRADPWINAPPGPVARGLQAFLERRSPNQTPWSAGWLAADRTVRGALDRALEALDRPFEGRVARDLAEAAPAGSILFAGSSMPVRDLDAYMAPRADLRVVANRGASGIDGSVSTVLGLAAATGGLVLGLIGDLALIHDAGALLWSGIAEDAAMAMPSWWCRTTTAAGSSTISRWRPNRSTSACSSPRTRFPWMRSRPRHARTIGESTAPTTSAMRSRMPLDAAASM
jgi:2-succinyl-5-enolpyruvyl-6-hydroxy-3-cyclohexene-1-carboxylate synthase